MIEDLKITSGACCFKHYDPSAKGALVLIQDASYTTRFHNGILAILDLLSERYGVRKIFPEGLGKDAFPGLMLHLIKGKDDAELRDMLVTGQLKPSEYFAITSNEPIELIGCDDMDAHQESTTLMLRLEAYRGKFTDEIARLKNELLKKRFSCNDPSLALDNKIMEYDQRKIQINTFYFHLHSLLSQNGIDVESRYPAFHTTIESFHDPYGSMDMFEQLLAGKEMKPQKVKEHLHPKDAAIRLSYSGEIDEVIKHLRTILCDTKEQKDIVEAGHTLELLEKTMTFSITPTLYRKFKSTRQDYSSFDLSRRLGSLGIIPQPEWLKLVDDMLPEMEKVYEMTSVRQRTLIDALNRNTDNGEVVAAVWGGFHSHPLEELVTQAGYSIYVMLPEHEPEGSSRYNYKELLSQRSRKLKKCILKDDQKEQFLAFFPQFSGFNPEILLGTGAYKRAVQLRDPDTNEKITLKIIDLNHLTKKALRLLEDSGFTNPLDAFAREVKVMERLSQKQSPFISNLLGYKLTDDYYLIVEAYSERTLVDYVMKNHPLDSALVDQMVLQFAEALALVHELGYHGDLHPHNVLFRNGVVNITDFGLCSTLPDGDHHKYLVPHSETRAIELFKGSHVDKRADIWSFGADCYFMRYAKMPFSTDFTGSSRDWSILSDSEREKFRMNVLKNIEDQSVYNRVISDVNEGFSQAAAPVIVTCLQKNPNMRYPDGIMLFHDLHSRHLDIE